jgi:hypothetical protein
MPDAQPVPIDELEREVSYLHRQFFHSAPPPEVIQRYIAANRLCMPAPDESARRLISTVVSRRLDSEAIELVLRLRRRSPILTKKIQILFYLVEVRSAYYTYFLCHGSSVSRAAVELFASVTQTCWKLIKGAYLVRRHGLV